MLPRNHRLFDRSASSASPGGKAANTPRAFATADLPNSSGGIQLHDPSRRTWQPVGGGREWHGRRGVVLDEYEMAASNVLRSKATEGKRTHCAIGHVQHAYATESSFAREVYRMATNA